VCATHSPGAVVGNPRRKRLAGTLRLQSPRAPASPEGTEVFSCPAIECPVALPVAPPQLAADVPRVPVLPDGRCLYYCVVAGRDTAGWLESHDSAGRPINPLVAADDREAADRLRDRPVAELRETVSDAAADRLLGSGSGAYPGTDELAALSRVIGGSIVVQHGRLQQPFGRGPLMLHVRYFSVLDGADNPSPHFELLQSWMATAAVTASEMVVLEGTPTSRGILDEEVWVDTPPPSCERARCRSRSTTARFLAGHPRRRCTRGKGRCARASRVRGAGYESRCIARWRGVRRRR